MNAQIRKVGLALVFGFLAVFLQLNYVQIFAAESIAENDANQRSTLREYSIKRGRILTLDSIELADSRATNGRFKYRRTYPEGELYGHITGYYSLFFGSERIERSYNEALLGDSGVLSMQDIQDRFLGSGEQGDDVRLTIVSRLQEIAREELGSQTGAVVAMDPTTGEVRALYSNPSFDPDPLASHDPKQARAFWETLKPNSPTSPLVNKATSRGYPPGSTFKVLSTAAALESGRYRRDSTFDDPVELELPLTNETLQNFSKTSCAGGGQIDLFTALEISCDTTFGTIGLEIPEHIYEVAEAVGFNARLPFDISTQPSGYPDIPDDDAPLRAYAAIGQGDVRATPLQMAVVASTVANEGRVIRPRLVREILDLSDGPVQSFPPEELGEAFSERTADTLTEMMVAVVDSGTGTAAQIDGVEVAGKTGTAQTGVEGESPHAWFICFAPANDPKLAVAVLVENGGTVGSEATGGAVAAPIAKAILEADRAIRNW